MNTNPFDLGSGAVQCPYPGYEALRNRGRAVHVPELDAWAITGYDDIQQILRRPGCASSRTPTGAHVRALIAAAVERARLAGQLPERVARHLADPPDPTLFTIDPPDHTRQRRAVARLFAPAQVAVWEPWVRELAAAAVESMAAKGAVDLVADFGVAIALGLTQRVLGLEGEIDRATLQRWADQVVAVIGDPAPSDDAIVAMLDARAEMAEVFTGLIARRRAAPSIDLSTAVAFTATDEAPIEGVVLTESERVGLLINFHVAGTESTATLLVNCAAALAADPALWHELDTRRDRIPAFVDEILRLEPPSQGMFRTLLQDVDIDGTPMSAGDQVYLVFAAGNRDSTTFAAPDDLDLHRSNGSRHLSFGQGAHLCLGAPLARMEARVAVGVLLDRLSAIEAGPEPWPRRSSYLLRGAESVPARAVG